MNIVQTEGILVQNNRNEYKDKCEINKVLHVSFRFVKLELLTMSSVTF